MPANQNDEQAFPHYPSAGEAPGMTLRDYFAANALDAILSQDDYGIHANAPSFMIGDSVTCAQNWATQAYEIADAMLRARVK